jgi:flagella basal body P-ring formation protein FlgA
MSKYWRLILATLVTAGISAGLEAQATTSTSAEASHSLSDIATTAAMTLQARATQQGYDDVEVAIRPLDSSLQLTACDQPLQTLPASAKRVLGPVSVGIRCEGSDPWTLYVRGTVSAHIDMPVLSTSVPRGELISSADVTLESRTVGSDLVGYVDNLDAIVGKVAKRNLRAGRPLRYSDLKAPVIVERGQTVSIVAGTAGLRVSMQGKALASGGTGDRVLVSNISTGKRLEGIVSADGSVLVQ